MAYGGYSYIDFEYEPKVDDFIALLWVKGKFNIEKLAEAIASESSVGTWTKIKTMNSRVFSHYRARVFKIVKVTETSGFVYIAYPYEHFDSKNVIQFMASVLGNLFGLKELEELYVLDISFPIKWQKLFNGPSAGIDGIRVYMKTNRNKRPHVGTIVKPKVGLTPKEFASVAYDAWSGGLDLVKDDENLVDQDFCRWKERFDETFSKLDKAEKETGERKLYVTNITDISIERMVKRLEYIKDAGGKIAMIDVFVLGLPAVKYIVDLASKYHIFIHAHRAGYAEAHRGNFGINFGVYEKLYRLVGVDQLHIGTGVGKMEGSPLLIKRYHDIAENRMGKEKFYLGFLGFKFASHIKPMFSIASGGMDPGRVDAAVALHGNNVIIQAGGGVHGHPKGTKAGAKALRAAVDAIVEGISAKEYAKKVPELDIALKYFGYIDPSEIRKHFLFEKENKELLTSMVMDRGMDAIRTIWSTF